MADENGKTIIPINIPDTMFFPDWKGERIIRRIYCQKNEEIPAGGTGYSLLFGLPKTDNFQELEKLYEGMDVSELAKKAIMQRSYGADSAAKKAVMEAKVDWSQCVPDEEDTVKAIAAGFQKALATKSTREPGVAAKQKEKASEYDMLMMSKGYDPENPEDRAAFRAVIQAEMTKKKAERKAKK
jgi:hypothetical protein